MARQLRGPTPRRARAVWTPRSRTSSASCRSARARDTSSVPTIRAKTLSVLLVAIGLALIVESFLPTETAALVGEPARPVVGFLLGLAIGLVSSLLGVAGGELIIPSFVFAFGVPIRLAGTASLLVSLPTVAVGIVRYWLHGAFADSHALRETVLPMAAASVIGAIIGGVLPGAIPAAVLKLGLGVILIASAIRVFRHAPDRS